MRINVAKVQDASLVDGPGLRTVVWLAGCDIQCPGCQNKELWTQDRKNDADAHDIAKALVHLNRFGPCNANGHFTITGGEPFLQADALTVLVASIRTQMPTAHIIVYTGHMWEELVSWGRPYRSVLRLTDILVDGPYMPERDDEALSYRGSRNQRAILSRRSMDGDMKPLVTNWDPPAGTIQNGAITLPSAVADLLGMTSTASPRCGQHAED